MIQIRVAAAKRKEEDDEVLHQKRKIETSKGRQGYWNLILVKLNLVNSIWEEGTWIMECRTQKPEPRDW